MAWMNWVEIWICDPSFPVPWSFAAFFHCSGVKAENSANAVLGFRPKRANWTEASWWNLGCKPMVLQTAAKWGFHSALHLLHGLW